MKEFAAEFDPQDFIWMKRRARRAFSKDWRRVVPDAPSLSMKLSESKGIWRWRVVLWAWVGRLVGRDQRGRETCCGWRAKFWR